MPKKPNRRLLEDIRASMSIIELNTFGLDKKRFLQENKTVDEVVRNLLIIGKSAGTLPQEFTAAHPDVEWASLAGLQNIDGHYGVNRALVWEIVHADLPKAQKILERLLK
jgi:uncharacterized protein with HEPN domain